MMTVVLNGIESPATHLMIADELRPRFMRIAVAMRREMRNGPLTVAQSAVLSALLFAGPLRISDLARNEGVATATMTQIIARMEAAGLVSRASPLGSYNNLISITSSGEAAASDLAKHRNEVLAQRMAKLSQRELQLLEQLGPILDTMFNREPWHEGGR